MTETNTGTQQYRQPENRESGIYMPLVVLAIIAGCFAVVQGAAHAEAARSVENFVQNAVVGNEFEIESSKLALQKSQNDDVRNYAQRMVNDHTKAGDDLASAVAASPSGMTMPAPTLDAKHQKLMDKLNAANGADFDRQYIKDQVTAHNEAVSLFDSYSRHGKDASVKSFAVQTLPTLEDHKKDIYQLKSSI